MRTFLFTRPRGNSLYFLHGELLCQGGDFAFPAGCPRRPCPADDLWVMISLCQGGEFRSPDVKASRFSILCRSSWQLRQRQAWTVCNLWHFRRVFLECPEDQFY